MKLVNLTPHALNIHTPNGVINVEPAGKVARLDEVRSPALPSEALGGVPVSLLSLQGVVGLPHPEPGTFYIVSGMVAGALVGERDDVLCPGPLVRDEGGRPVGCEGLTVRI